MNLQSIEKLDMQNGDVIILRATDINNDQLKLLMQQLHSIKNKSGKDIQFLLFPNDWAKLLSVQITDVKGRIFEVDKLIKQLIRIQQRLQNRFKVQGNPDELTNKILQNLQYVKNQRGI